MRSAAIAILAAVTMILPSASAESAPGYVTAEDIMTDTDAFYFRYINPDPALDVVSKWPIVGHIMNVSGNLIDAGVIADHLNEGLPVDKQPAFAHVKKMVDECAARLGVTSPHLFIKSDPQVNAYVTRLKEAHLLVLTSSLYELYKERPDELRFIIRHELGHIRCNHIRCHAVGHALMSFIVGDQPTTGIKEDLVAHVMVGQLLGWYRESEMSADRAGLVCVDGNVDVARKALQRLLHGTKEDVDPEIAASEQIAFEKAPFVKIVRKIRSSKQTHPFISDRCLALQEWTTTSSYKRLAQRKSASPAKKRIFIDEIEVTGLPDSDVGFGTAADPIIQLAIGAEEFKSGEFSNNNNPKLEDLDWSAPYVPNTRLILEVLDYDGATGNDFIGACLISIREGKSGTAKVELRRDIKEASSEVKLPDVRIKYRIENSE
ncbi:MAG: M48 family metalloprotease [Pirellulales bacterium]